MPRIPPVDKKPSFCRSCRADITLPGDYTGSIQCSVCYFRERCEALPTLTKTLGDIRARLNALSKLVPEARNALELYRLKLQVSTSWLKRLFGTPSDHRLSELTKEFSALSNEPSEVRSRFNLAKAAVEAAKSAKKHLLQAELARSASQRKAKKEHDEQTELANESSQNLANAFDRTLFFIQSHDYRRGNAIDNYCRSVLLDAILTAFEQRCAFCGCSDDLTVDHYGLTKNEGGNFVLIASDKRSLRINLVVLCRACNSTKGQLSHLHFFDDARRTAIVECHSRFLSSVLADTRFLKLLKKWGRVAG
jgi:hypothetical protein